MPNLLTEPEVAKILRCSPHTVARIRKAGKLPYIPSRPVLIDEADLLTFVGKSPLLTEEQAGECLGLKPTQVRWLRDTGRIGSCPLRPTMYREEDIQAYFAAKEADRAREAANLIAIEDWKSEQEERKARLKAMARIPVLRLSRHGVWYLHWSEGHRSKRISTRTHDKNEAAAFLRRWRKDKGV